jgi:hypothetical protein
MLEKYFLNFILLLTILTFSACTQNRQPKVYLERNCLVTIPTPSILGESFSAHHSLNFQTKDNSFQMHAQMEFENQELTIVGLNTAFATIFSLKQVGPKITYVANIKSKIKPKFILGTYYLIFSPFDKIKELLPKNTICTETINENLQIRKFFVNKIEIFNIQYSPYKNGTKIVFENIKRNLIFTIIEDYRTKL